MTELEGKERLSWPDLARGAAVFLVALGHSPLVAEELKCWIYSFHMPLFFFISGYFLVRKEDSVRNMIRKKACSMLPLYFLCSFGGFLLESVLSGKIMWDSLLGIFLCQFGKYDSYLWFFPAIFWRSMSPDICMEAAAKCFLCFWALLPCGGEHHYLA